MIKDSAPAPMIPPRTSVRTPKQPRRRSLPNSSSTTATVKRSPNHVTIMPASPEVISSLISSLSAISSLADNHFESPDNIDYSRSTPASPHSYCADFLSPSTIPSHVPRPYPTSPAKIGFGMEHGATGRLYLSPRGASSVHASLRSSNSYNDFRSRSRRRIDDDANETCSIGQLSIDPAPWRSSTSLASEASNQPRGGKLGLGIMSSSNGAKESPGMERRQDHGELQDRLHEMIPQSPQASSVHSGTTANRLSTDLNGSPVVGNGHVVPSRESSLRHSLGGTSRHRRRRSQRSHDYTAEDQPRPIDEDKLASKIEESQVVAHDTVEDEVTRRIQELKDQKRLRDISLRVTTPDLMPPSQQARRSPSPLRQLQLPNTPQDPLAHGSEPVDGVINEFEHQKPDENSAPSPSVVQRVDRKNKRNSTSGKPLAMNPFSSARPPKPSRTQSTPIQRSNSKLLRRLSRPTSPAIAEKHRRTFSHLEDRPLSPIDRPKSVDSVDDAVHQYLSAPRLTQTTTDPKTGRTISFSEVGDPEGSVVFCCVGMGLTRYITAFYDELAKTLKLRLVTPDRPGVGGSEVHADGTDTPLGWPDDVLAICQKLKLTKFSILAHSAGAIYALATALRMPQHIRGRIHLLAPWIPPSQMSGLGTTQESLPATSLPLTQRFLQSLPTTFLRAANSNYLRSTSASVTTSLPKSPRQLKRASMKEEPPGPRALSRTPTGNGPLRNPKIRGGTVLRDPLIKEATLSDDSDSVPPVSKPASLSEKEWRSTYDGRLTAEIWNASTTGANPAVDLLVCLERKQAIGFRYVDITKSVIVHHGSKDSRVPLENVKWLGKTMRRCEVRVLEGEGHGLMASAGVMGNVLMEMAKEWEDWNRVVQGEGGTNRREFSP